VHRLCIASVPIVLLLVSCTHQSSASRPPTPQASPAATPSSPNNSVPASAPESPTRSAPPAAAPPVNPPETAATAGATAPTSPDTPSQAAAARSGPSSRKSSPAEIPPKSAGAQATRPPPAPAAAPRPPTAAAATPALDLTDLQQRLRDTRAIGVFTKLSLKNQVDDLLAQFRSFHNGGSKVSLTELRQKFELLLLKVVTLLQDNDPSLAAAVSSSREAIWGMLSDPKKFANI
jgi:hypothetical protein